MGTRGLALVTGATSGIGEAMTRELAARGHDLALVARSTERLALLAGELHAAHGVAVTPLPADLSRPDAVPELVAELGRRGLSVELLVNNAGVGMRGGFAELPVGEQLALLRLNVLALTELTHALIPGMRHRGAGGVLNVASTAAFQPGPWMAVYYASKAYVLHFSEALAEELRASGVAVTALCPGPTHSRFSDRAGMGETRLFGGTLPVAQARCVAIAGLDGLERGRRLVIPGFLNKLGALATRVTPRRLQAAIVSWLQS